MTRRFVCEMLNVVKTVLIEEPDDTKVRHPEISWNDTDKYKINDAFNYIEAIQDVLLGKEDTPQFF